MRIALAVALGIVFVQAGCSIGGEQGIHRTNVVTRASLAGIRLGDSESAVESMFGRGRALRHEPHAFRYRAGLTVYYDTAQGGTPTVALVLTGSHRFRTVSGVGVGSTLAMVEALGQMDCGPTSTAGSGAECLTERHAAYSPGLMFDLVDGHVTRLGLVERTD